MKILMTAYPNDVTWSYAVELCRGLQRDGVRFVLALMGEPLTDPQRAQLHALGNVEFFESSYSAEWAGSDEGELQRAGHWLLDLAATCDVDLVQLNEFAFGALPWRTAPLVSTPRGLPPATLADRARACLRAAGALVAPSRAALEEVQRAFGTARLSWVVPFGRSADGAVRRTKELMIAATGSFEDANAGMAVLGRVAARVSWPVFVVAPAPVQPERQLVNVHFLGDLSNNDRSSVLSRASIFVAPGSNSFDVIEAGQCGCALVLGDAPHLREQWDGAACFIDVNDDESLHATLLRLIRDSDARTDFSTRAVERAASYSIERMAASYLAVYIELALRSIGRPIATHSS